MDKIKTVKIKNPDGSVSEETYTVQEQSVVPDKTRGGCPQNQYCALLWTTSTWGTNDATPNVTKGVASQRIYGKCQRSFFGFDMLYFKP